ncbi:hypothetical protein LB506_001118 [Fusarium annulatum]|uniref:Uncharacterized protein n=2 Tax=Fusarium fujikuroi species complex TaxID=171627 RepID=A0A0I9XPJ9_FUSFU|nr:hypothetical protein FPRO03_00339 [Fusarium proliferatum]KAI1057872.1 hypothetical protein LB506_001118 [Fusarium annulatum]KLO84970.1 uncharacterized protein LW93_2855 [Fusarium fujikuroi]KAG4287118.1 hypothetical protein FPRO04_00661 [Fusarium proliferatum]KLO92985.1 uncharacterized protein Y057_1459 [Fusarium fujikuroi]
MKGCPIDELVYECMFPRPKSNDPQNFQALLQRLLIPEVRQETHSFYGHLDTQEAKYPGLDYTHHTHRIRLSRWQWHRRLFRAFDSLKLTGAEIAGLTKWEGTKWAKEKYEKEQGYVIHDTTADGFPDWADIEHLPRANRDQSVEVEGVAIDDLYNEMMEVESEDELDSVGVELNERLRDGVARRDAGDTSAVLDEEWEQWLKNAIESGEINYLNDHIFHDSDTVPAALFPPGLLSTARAGQWHEIPESLHRILRRTLQSEDPNRPQQMQTLPPPQPQTSSLRSTSSLRRRLIEGQQWRASWRRSAYSDLRLPVGDASSRLADNSNA